MNTKTQIVHNCYCCPHCLSSMEKQNQDIVALQCSSCGSQFPVRKGIPLLCNNHNFYYGEATRKETLDLLRLLDECDQFDVAVRKWLALFSKDMSDYLMSYILDEKRTSGKYVLNLTGREKVLDLGSGWGGFSLNLADHVREIHGIDLTFERLLFSKYWSKHRHISNFHTCCCGDTLHLPFTDKYFDIAIINGVLEWIPMSQSGNPLQIQQDYLKEVRRILSDTGQVYMAIENRFALSYFLGRPDDHSGLKYGSLLPRKIADLYSKKIRKCTYRTYTHSHRKYISLLKNTLFRNIFSFVPLPIYRYPKKIITLNRRNSSEEKKPLNIKEKIKKYLTENKAFAESFIFIGTNGRFHSLIDSIIEKEFYHADYQVYDLQITHTGTCISRVKGRDESSPALIIKIPVNDYARFRLRSNFRNMEELRTRFPIIRETTPIPITFGCFNNQDYWVESYIQGLSGETIGREKKQQIIFNSFNKLMDIHIDSRISASIEKLNDKIEKTYCAFQGSDILWDAAEKSIIAKAFTFLKHNIPEQTFFVLGHNDYHLGNILFDPPSMNVAGILDWDLASKYEFALLDALHLIVRSNKADNTIITSLEKNVISPSAADNKLLVRYMKILSIPSKDFTFYLMIYLFELLKKDLSTWQMGLGGVEKLYFSMTIEEIHNLIKLIGTIL